MHENNPFQNIKNYWGSHYSSITESAEKHLADFAGYAVYKDGKWYQSEGDVKKRKGISSDELWNRHGDEYKRHLDSRKGANEDKDSRDGESTRSEEVEYDGEQLDELSDDLLKRYIAAAQKSKMGAKKRGREELARKRTRGQISAFRLLGKPIDIEERKQGADSLADELFHKDSDRLLREHIRAEYEACGIYPTSREVQETYNHVVSILNERNQANKEASRRAEIESGREVQGRNWGSEEDAINSARNTKAGLVNSPMPPTMRQSYDATGIRRSKHIAKRGDQTNISPSSPARQQSGVEQHTRNQIARSPRGNRSRGIRWFARNRGNDDTESLLKQGFSPSHLRRIMSDSGR